MYARLGTGYEVVFSWVIVKQCSHKYLEGMEETGQGRVRLDGTQTRVRYGLTVIPVRLQILETLGMVEYLANDNSQIKLPQINCF